jgi:hypothetical protein
MAEDLSSKPVNVQSDQQGSKEQPSAEDSFAKLFKSDSTPGPAAGEFTRLFGAPPISPPIEGSTTGAAGATHGFSKPATEPPNIASSETFPGSAEPAIPKAAELQSPAAIPGGATQGILKTEENSTTPEAPAPGAFTQLFSRLASPQVAPAETSQTTLDRSGPGAPVPAAKTATQTSIPEPGAFTQLFAKIAVPPSGPANAPPEAAGPVTKDPPGATSQSRHEHPQVPSSKALAELYSAPTLVFRASERDAILASVRAEPSPPAALDDTPAKIVKAEESPFKIPEPPKERTPAAAEVPAPQQAGSFTQLFSTSMKISAATDDGTATPVVAAPVPSDRQSAAHAPAPQAAATDDPAPGLLNELFRSPSSAPKDEFVPAAPAAEVAAKRKTEEEFARAVNFPLRDASAAPRRAPEPPAASGDFTQLFGRSFRPDALQPPAQTAGGKEAGEFTKFFNAPKAGLEAREPSSFTQAFGVEKPAPGTPFSASPIQQHEAPGTFPSFSTPETSPCPQSGGPTDLFSRPKSAEPPQSATPVSPGAFTQFMRGQAPPAIANQPYPQPPASEFPSLLPPISPANPMSGISQSPQMPPGIGSPFSMPAPPVQFSPPQVQFPPATSLPPIAPKKTNWIPIIIGANVFFVLVVILILVFVLRK